MRRDKQTTLAPKFHMCEFKHEWRKWILESELLAGNLCYSGKLTPGHTEPTSTFEFSGPVAVFDGKNLTALPLLRLCDSLFLRIA